MIISVAIPCYKSKNTIAQVVARAKDAILSRPENDYQFILVNDYPADETFDVIRGLCKEDQKIIGVNMTKNFGQVSATLAAMSYFKGDVLVCMDDDGQHPAEAIYRLVDKVCEGYDVVYAHLTHKKHSVFKRATSRINSFVAEINGTKPKGIYLSSFAAYSRTAVEALQKYDSPFPSIGGYLSSVVSNYANVEIEHQERIQGSSNYTLKKLLHLWLTGFTNFSLVPIRAVLYIGVVVAVLGFISGLIIIIRRIFHSDLMPGYASTIALIMFFSGLILFFFCFIGKGTADFKLASIPGE